MRVKVRRKRQKILDKETLHHWLWEWQPIGATEWYPINENNVVADYSLRCNIVAMEVFRQFKNQINQGKTFEVEAAYDKSSKQLVITAIYGIYYNTWKERVQAENAATTERISREQFYNSSLYERMEENLRRLKNQPVEVFA